MTEFILSEAKIVKIDHVNKYYGYTTCKKAIGLLWICNTRKTKTLVYAKPY